MTIIRRVFTPIAWLALHVAGWAISGLSTGIGEDHTPIDSWPDSSDWED